ncbi:hypothetical protein HU200_018040 [Digitaria exilis]|uniref:Reverse transcriptase zinc-binding domain-containing protein n=1 Tax=Digitaria exilis TaxID=1010633 RepID=A0A835KH74_9POAL|nr:hypothetical protein HU200_018040 [Digitaria exilis]
MQDPDSARAWQTRVPKKVKFFAWLLHRERLNTRGYIYQRNICTLVESFCEHCKDTPETPEHIFKDCPIARNVWESIGVSVQPGLYKQPWLLGHELPLPLSVALDVMLVILWQLWKARNALIFDHKHSNTRDVLQRVTDDLKSWSCRYKSLEPPLLCWREHLLSLL